MDSFLGRVAADILARYGDDLSSLSLVMPSRRARLFFAEELSRRIGRPLWMPHFVSVGELMEEAAGIAEGDRIRLIAELYKIYARYHEETFDHFYFWGETLLQDFDSVDKYMIDARMLFSNLHELKEVDGNHSYLTDEQREVIARFWSCFGQEASFSGEQQEFMNVWKTLLPVYERYRARLGELGFAYGGMVYRTAAERIRAGQGPDYGERRFAVAGFNALSASEKVLFDYLRQEGKADFYWDSDPYYADDPWQEAGMFLRENRQRYPEREPAAVPEAAACGTAAAASAPERSVEESVAADTGFRSPKEIVAVAAPSDSMQCKYAGSFLERIARETGRPPGRETAVVLTDENLLLPLLHALPESVGSVNVTMGYPLRQHPVYGFAERLMELQRRRRDRDGGVLFHHADVSGLLKHPYVLACCPDAEGLAAEIERKGHLYVRGSLFAASVFLKEVFAAPAGWQAESDYLLHILSAAAANLCGPDEALPAGADAATTQGCFALLAEHIRKLANSLIASEIDPAPSVFRLLLRRVLQQVRIPFSGEPLLGLQVMGILETRCLDFEQVIVLSMNDDTFPGNRTAPASFIPHNLRYGYGLPTPAHREGIYAYYFYRLLQRARRVQLVYSTRTDETTGGEPSRYIHQLAYESPHRVESVTLGVDVNLSAPRPIAIPKDASVMERLETYTRNDGQGRHLSPTALYHYLECPLKFYFRTVAGLRAEDPVTEEIGMPLFGTIFHSAMERLYTPLKRSDDPREALRALTGTGHVADAVRDAVAEHFCKGEPVPESEYGGNLMMAAEIIRRYIDRCILPFDAALQPFRIEALEERIACRFPFRKQDGCMAEIGFQGIADRIDRLGDGTLRVVDYKTGVPHNEFNGLEALFTPGSGTMLSAVFQTLLYGLMLRSGTDAEVLPVLYYVRTLRQAEPSVYLIDRQRRCPVMRFSDYEASFSERLAGLLAELFDPAVPFTQCDDNKPCARCDFNTICRR